MIGPWGSRRKMLSMGAVLGAVLAVSGIGLVGPLPALAADTSTTDPGAADAAEPGPAGHDDVDRPYGDARYLRFRVCANATTNTNATDVTSTASDAVDVTGSGTTSTTTSTTSTTTSSTTDTPGASPTTDTSSATPDPNADVAADDPVFVLLPMKTDRAKDYDRVKRRGLCYDLDTQQIVKANDTSADAITHTGTTTTTTTDTTTPATTTPAAP
jgi:hypothetical protein